MARPRGNRESTEARRDAILEAALEIFGRYGYNGSSLAQVAEIVGVTDAAIVHHFGSKRQLMLEVLTRRDDMTSSLIQDDDNDNNGIDFVAGWLDITEYNSMHPGIVELFTVLAAESTSANHPAHAYFTQRYSYVFDRLRKSFDRLKQNGHLDSTEDCVVLTRKLMAISDGLQVQWLLDRQIPMLQYHHDFYKGVLHSAAWQLVLAKREQNAPWLAKHVALIEK